MLRFSTHQIVQIWRNSRILKLNVLRQEKLETGTVTLPTYPGYPLKDVEKLALEIRKFYGLSI